MQHEKARPGMERQIQDALTVALPQKIRRLTSSNFLEKVKEFAVGLLAAAGQLILHALKAILASLVSGALWSFLQKVILK